MEAKPNGNGKSALIASIAVELSHIIRAKREHIALFGKLTEREEILIAQMTKLTEDMDA
uniref:Uncharacterized protein n=1 Tax=viral metagenome TaxID=1070528 RepID=A0A6H1ZPQ8_9ZZZZ